MNKIIQFLLLAAVLLSATAQSQAATQFDFLLSQVRTSVGSLAGGKAYFYSPGTLTAKTIWLDRNQGTIAANPYTLDSNGTAQVFGAGVYRIIIKDASGVTKFDRDGIVAAGDDGTANFIDATAGNQTFILPVAGVSTICKTDSTANTVTITPSTGSQTLTLDPLSVGGECVRLGLSGTVWYVE